MPFFCNTLFARPPHPFKTHHPPATKQKRTTNKIARILKVLANKTNYISILNTTHLTPFKSSNASEQFKNDQHKNIKILLNANTLEMFDANRRNLPTPRNSQPNALLSAALPVRLSDSQEASFYRHMDILEGSKTGTGARTKQFTASIPASTPASIPLSNKKKAGRD